MRHFVAIVLAVALSGCAAKVISSSPRTVIVQAGAVMAKDAQDLATQECAKHGRHARLAGRPEPGGPPQFVFDCVV